MAIVPVTINGGLQPTGNYSHSWGKFSYGYIGKTDFSENPDGLTWISSFDFDALKPNGFISVLERWW